ncbi:hypothetical protein F5ESL0230_00605 [Lactobacillus sp. ESL0230]|nr:hypothetical protein F5ESL0230_00605 [Lactobacillus sp. ESL0230]
MNWINIHKKSLFYGYVLIELLGYIFFATDIINCNIQQYCFRHLPIWLNLVLIVIQISILIYLWPKRIK